MGDERKELVAEMLRQGLFTSPSAGTPSSNLAQGREVEDRSDNASISQEMAVRGALQGLNCRVEASARALRPETQTDGLPLEDDENQRERVIRKMLQECAANARS